MKQRKDIVAVVNDNSEVALTFSTLRRHVNGIGTHLSNTRSDSSQEEKQDM